MTRKQWFATLECLLYRPLLEHNGLSILFSANTVVQEVSNGVAPPNHTSLGSGKVMGSGCYTFLRFVWHGSKCALSPGDRVLSAPAEHSLQRARPSRSHSAFQFLHRRSFEARQACNPKAPRPNPQSRKSFGLDSHSGCVSIAPACEEECRSVLVAMSLLFCCNCPAPPPPPSLTTLLLLLLL